jgi:heat shock protein HslJ
MRKTTMLSLLAAAILLSACGPHDPATDLADTRWWVTSYSANGQLVEVALGDNAIKAPYIWFQDQAAVSGVAGCNDFQNMSAPAYTSQQGDDVTLVLAFHDVATSAVSCEADGPEVDLMAVEEVFTAFLWSDAVAVTIATDTERGIETMTWESPGASPATLRFERPHRP